MPALVPQAALLFDVAGCPNRCRHCWLGHTPNRRAPFRRVADETIAEIGAEGVHVDDNIAKVSLVGAGMKSELGIAARMFRILSKHGINIEMISTSPIRISCVVSGDDVGAAVAALHDGFGLGEQAEEVSA